MEYLFDNFAAEYAGLYVTDNIFFNFEIVIRAFFRKVEEPSDIAPPMAVGFAINHIAAVVLPVSGGAFRLIDCRIPFIAGAALSFFSLIFVRQIKTGGGSL